MSRHNENMCRDINLPFQFESKINYVTTQRKYVVTFYQHFLDLHLLSFSLKTNSRQGVFTHIQLNILVKTHLIIKNSQFKYEQQHFISLFKIICKADVQTKIFENNKAIIHFQHLN